MTINDSPDRNRLGKFVDQPIKRLPPDFFVDALIILVLLPALKIVNAVMWLVDFFGGVRRRIRGDIRGTRIR